MSETHHWRHVKRAHSTLEGRDTIPRQRPYATLGISLLNAQMAHATEDSPVQEIEDGDSLGNCVDD